MYCSKIFSSIHFVQVNLAGKSIHVKRVTSCVRVKFIYKDHLLLDHCLLVPSTVLLAELDTSN